ETWYRAGRWRLEDPRRIQVFAGGQLWSYERSAGRVTVRRASGPFAHPPSGFSLTAVTRDLARWGWRDRLRLLADITLAGRRVRQVVIERAGAPTRERLLVDPATDLPLQVVLERSWEGGWAPEAVNDCSFNQPIPPA